MEAKVLILDLLGWGLSPENLVEAGISKYCLVPCLRELKLRLPTNIDLSDVVLYDPPIPPSESHMTSKVESNVSSNGTSPRAPNSSEQPAVTGDPAVPLSPYKRKRKSAADLISTTNQADSPHDPPAPAENNPPTLLQRLLPAENPSSEGHQRSNSAELRHAASSSDRMDVDLQPTDQLPSLPMKAQKRLAKNATIDKSVPMLRKRSQSGMVRMPDSHSSNILIILS
jgi:hypothetical protein